MKKLLKATEVAEVLGVCKVKVYELLGSGLPSVKFDGACCGHSDKLRDWIEQHSAEPPHRLVTPTAARGTRRSGKGRGEASQRVRRILKKDPTLSITKLSERANVSHGYASQVHAHVLSEHHHNPFPCG